MGYGIPHWDGFGWIPPQGGPQGGPQADREATSERKERRMGLPPINDAMMEVGL